MAKVYLEYNPYTLKTIFKRDGISPKKSSFFTNKSNFETRLQDWIVEFPKELHEEVNENKIEIDFKGTKIDFEDLERACKQYTKCEFILRHVYEEDISKKEKQIEEIYKKIMNSPVEKVRDKKILSRFKKSIESTLEINVLATMSAGKSTVLNALMSEEILPSQNIPCTAVIFKIFNNKDNFYKAEIVGNNKIIESYTETENRSLLSKLKKVNESDYIKENDIEEVRVYGKVPFIGDTDDNLILVDTPGPNNANNEDHGIVTQKMIMESDKDLVLYIMDVSTLSTDDSKDLLDMISESMENGGLQARDRIMFVINKLDELREGESIEDILKEARKFIEKRGIKNPNIYPVSGLSALELRKLQRDYCGNITSEDLIKDKKYEYQVKIENFNENLHFEKYSSLGGMGKEIIERELQEAIDNNDIVSQAIIHTGIRSLEEAINQYLNRYFKTDKIRSTIMDLEKKIKSDELDVQLKEKISSKIDAQETIKENLSKLKKERNSGNKAKEFGRQIDSIDLKEDFYKIAMEGENKLSDWHVKFLDEEKDNIMNIEKAKEEVKKREKIMGRMERKFLINTEKRINEELIKKSREIIDNYNKYLKEVSEELSFTDIDFNIQGILNYNLQKQEDFLIENIINDEAYEEEVVVGQELRRNPYRKWYKPWTLFTEPKYYYEDIVENQEFVEITEVLARLIDPLELSFSRNIKNLINLAISREEKIKKEYRKTLDELDNILDKKLEEINSLLNEYESDNKTLNKLKEQQEYLEDLKKSCEAVISI